VKPIQWERYPHLSELAQRWLTIGANLGLATNTIAAYGRSLEEFFAFCKREQVEVEQAKREHIARYVHDMAQRPRQRAGQVGLANATMQQRLTALRLFYDFLVAEGCRERNPVGRGKYVPGRSFGGARDRGLIPHYRRLPWIPGEEEWRAILKAACQEPVRNRFMLALAYDSALRREELCALATGDIDPAQRLLHIRAETTKTRQARVVPYSMASADLLVSYLRERRTLSRERGALFLSDSRRNRAQPISIWTWSKVVRSIALRANVPQFTTHTLRHLCLTDLARANWDLHEIAQFAGHRTTQTTLLYIHLSGRELAQKLASGMDSIHQWRVSMLEQMLT
jgi:integrase/recombinase XerD